MLVAVSLVLTYYQIHIGALAEISIILWEFSQLWAELKAYILYLRFITVIIRGWMKVLFKGHFLT